MSADGAEICFVDTNVFVYALTEDDPARSAKAQQLIAHLRSTRSLRTSTQVLSELFVTLTRKVRAPLSPAAALEYLDQIAAWPVIAPDYSAVRDACQLSTSARVSFWDALVVIAASRAGAVRLYSEDLNAGQKLLGVEVVNPFRVG
ncbi:MAG: PIN domain-containing protein [Terriglobales bacterium]